MGDESLGRGIPTVLPMPLPDARACGACGAQGRVWVLSWSARRERSCWRGWCVQGEPGGVWGAQSPILGILQPREL